LAAQIGRNLYHSDGNKLDAVIAAFDLELGA
jgi:hypothetical protein